MPHREGREEAPSETEERFQEPEGDDRRPTPVRMAMEHADEESEGDGDQVLVRDPATGVEWVVRVCGRSSAGILPLRSIPLMEVAFSKAGTPDLPVRRAILPDGNLREIPDPELLSVLEVSEPFQTPREIPKGKSGRERRGPRRRGRER